MKLNTHGLKMRGIKDVSGWTKGLRGYYTGEYIEIFYDVNDGEVFKIYQYSLGQSTWTKFDDTGVIKITNASSPMTMQEIADLVYAVLEEIKIGCAYEEEMRRYYENVQV